MEAFEYVAPRSLEEAYRALANGKQTAVLAGGTDIIVQLREGRKRADQVVDVKRIPELVGLKWLGDGGLEIGAATPCAEIYEDAEVVRRLPGLIDAAALIGGIQIQSRASLGGTLCNASPAADSAPALIALGARLVIGSGSGNRELPVEEFFLGPGRNALQPGELRVKVIVPPQPARSGAFFLRFIPRNEMDIAVVSAGARIQMGESGKIEGARVALGAVAATPLLVEGAAQALIGQEPGEAAFAGAGDEAGKAARPITDMRGSIAQRRHLAKVLTMRALAGAWGRIEKGR